MSVQNSREAAGATYFLIAVAAASMVTLAVTGVLGHLHLHTENAAFASKIAWSTLLLSSGSAVLTGMIAGQHLFTKKSEEDAVVDSLIKDQASVVTNQSVVEGDDAEAIRISPEQRERLKALAPQFTTLPKGGASLIRGQQGQNKEIKGMSGKINLVIGLLAVAVLTTGVAVTISQFTNNVATAHTSKEVAFYAAIAGASLAGISFLAFTLYSIAILKRTKENEIERLEYLDD